MNVEELLRQKTGRVETIDPDTGLGSAAAHVVVVVGDRLEGIISIGDVLESRLDVCELEVGVLRDYNRVRGAAARL
jgi:hypothetical protein